VFGSEENPINDLDPEIAIHNLINLFSKLQLGIVSSTDIHSLLASSLQIIQQRKLQNQVTNKTSVYKRAAKLASHYLINWDGTCFIIFRLITMTQYLHESRCSSIMSDYISDNTRIVYIKPKYSRKEFNQYLCGIQFLENELDLIISRGINTQLLDAETGEHVCTYIFNAVQNNYLKNPRDLYGSWKKDNIITRRGDYAGRLCLEKIQCIKPEAIDVKLLVVRSGVHPCKGHIVTKHKTMKPVISNPSASYHDGWGNSFNCAWRAGLFKTNPVLFEQLGTFLLELSRIHKEHVPDVHAAQVHFMQGREQYLLFGTPFSSLSINFSASYGHLDPGDFKDSKSITTVISNGRWRGGLFVVMYYNVGIDVGEGDCVIINSHKQPHCNTPIIKSDPDAWRMSVVMYLDRGFKTCRAPQ
jgi:hypothetical protein